jgi:hypothetical protein
MFLCNLTPDKDAKSKHHEKNILCDEQPEALLKIKLARRNAGG